ncbi:helix-turn-helix domain-containing protein [Algicola sagamiensis]|uniref:helix-turn-helix domain-containing protein n=1 Tax=Algicola sagamiensis TaxID=163869 RepID=UPI000362CF64|nr:helix-turn-helix transcriptional regulator [Algicola sagamiensis]
MKKTIKNLKKYASAEIAAFVKEARKSQKITQEDMSKLVETSQSNLSYMERDQQKISLVDFLIICMRCSADYESFIKKILEDAEEIKDKE